MSDLRIEAVHFLRKLRGSSQAILARCSNERYYVIKFTNNPNGLYALMNEVVTTNLAHTLNLPFPNYAFVYVSEWLVGHSPEFVMLRDGEYVKYEAGIHFGSETPYRDDRGQWAYEYLPPRARNGVEEISAFAGTFLLDVWTGRQGIRQVVFCRRPRTSYYDPLFIDHRLNFSCVHSGESTSVPPTCHDLTFYDWICGWHAFEPWLTTVEQMDEMTLSTIFHFPDEWNVTGEWKAGITSYLLNRRRLIRALISQFRDFDRRLFPNWGMPPRLLSQNTTDSGLDPCQVPWLSHRSLI